ncbi:amino acid ABC transporter ATP-binding protein [Candidatus Saccharibacteria bacterium]|nr:amino acid ABC transporter ATP-binding protein [Candidatus Saccharibacteria bacterium]
MITVKNLHKNFGDQKILKGINFELSTGECVAVLGPSGSGKSTFLRCINRLEEPTSGEIFFKDELITKNNIKNIRRHIGMVFQHFNLIKNLTVTENLILAPTELNLLSKDAAEKKARSLLRSIDLLDKANSFPASLSGGQQQRIAIIRAMMLDPEVLLFDEPTSALDPESIKDVLALIRSLATKNLTLIIVTHELNFAKEIATRIIFLDEGKIIEDSEKDTFFQKPKTPRAEEFLSKVL